MFDIWRFLARINITSDRLYNSALLTWSMKWWIYSLSNTQGSTWQSMDGQLLPNFDLSCESWMLWASWPLRTSELTTDKEWDANSLPWLPNTQTAPPKRDCQRGTLYCIWQYLGINELRIRGMAGERRPRPMSSIWYSRNITILLFLSSWRVQYVLYFSAGLHCTASSTGQLKNN